MCASRPTTNDLPALLLVDDGQGGFGPLCDLRPVHGLRTGVCTTAERLAVGHRVVGERVPDRLAGLVRERSGHAVNDAAAVAGHDRILAVNGALASWSLLAGGLPAGDDEVALTTATGRLVAARLGRASAEVLLATGSIPVGVRRQETSAGLLDAPGQVLDGLARWIAADIDALAADAEGRGYRSMASGAAAAGPGQWARMGEHRVLVHGSATIAPYVVFDASAGPIHVAEKAVIRPFTVLCGPCSIGPGSTVGDRSLIKPNTTCGPQCRLGGEVGGTSIIGFSNKTHDGHLGDSLLGEWVNLGAGTDNSNLLNTYGEVPLRLEPDGPRQRTGRIFLGAVIGDHVKCAIGTRLMTGTVVGTGAMIAASTPPPATVRRFAWITDDGERRYALPKFVEVLRTVMKRRSLEPGPAYLAAIETLHRAAEAAGAPS